MESKQQSPGLRASQKFLVVEEGAELPPRCPICNRPALSDPVIFTFKAEFRRGLIRSMVGEAWDQMRGSHYTEPVTIVFRFCAFHRARKKLFLMVCAFLFAIGTIGSLLAIRYGGRNTPIPLLTMPLAVVGFLFAGFIVMGEVNPWFTPSRFERRTVWLKGAGRAYLNSLTENDPDEPPHPDRPTGGRGVH